MLHIIVQSSLLRLLRLIGPESLVPILILLGTSSLSLAQSQIHLQSYGTNGIEEVASTIIGSPDSNLIVGGRSDLNGLVMKVTPTGQVVWARTFVNVGGERQRITGLAITPDGYIIGIGNAEPLNGSRRRDGFVFKMTSAGTLVWSRTEIHPTDIFMDKIIAQNANEYVISCAYRFPNSPNLDIVLAKVDAATGNVIGLSDRIDLGPSYYLDDPFGLVSPNGTDIYVSGRLYANGVSPESMRPYIAKFDANLQYDWAKYYQKHSSEQARIYGTHLIASNNDLVSLTVGNRYSSQAEYCVGLFKTNAAGQLLWSKDYNVSSSISEISYGLVETTEGYCILGSLASNDIVLIQADFDGNLLWSKVIDSPLPINLDTWAPAITFLNGKISITATETGSDKQILVATLAPSAQYACATFQDIGTIIATIAPYQENSFVNAYQDSLPMTVGPAMTSLSMPSLCNMQIPNLGPDTAFCTGSLLLDATILGDNDYLWQDGSTNPTLLVSAYGTYWVQVSNNCCIVRDTMIVTGGIAVELGPDTVVCNGSTLALDAGNPGSSYLWSNGATTQTIVISQAGHYAVTVIDTMGCIAMDSILLTVKALPNLDLGPNIERCGEDGVLLVSPIVGQGYLWSTGAQTRSIFVDTTGLFGLQVMTECETISDSIQVVLYKENRLFVPNVFSPDGDGINDVFKCDGPIDESFEMDIFDRWGRHLFHSDDIAQGWNGTLEHNACPGGVYFLTIRVLNCDRRLSHQAQALTLLR
jgi:gliding motility-associated-like protein